jgi:hypothetical protein
MQFQLFKDPAKMKEVREGLGPDATHVALDYDAR